MSERSGFPPEFPEGQAEWVATEHDDTAERPWFLWIVPTRPEPRLRRAWDRLAWRLWRHRRWQDIGTMEES